LRRSKFFSNLVAITPAEAKSCEIGISASGSTFILVHATPAEGTDARAIASILDSPDPSNASRQFTVTCSSAAVSNGVDLFPIHSAADGGAGHVNIYSDHAAPPAAKLGVIFDACAADIKTLATEVFGVECVDTR
jgi:hypothetical protein